MFFFFFFVCFCFRLCWGGLTFAVDMVWVESLYFDVMYLWLILNVWFVGVWFVFVGLVLVVGSGCDDFDMVFVMGVSGSFFVRPVFCLM